MSKHNLFGSSLIGAVNDRQHLYLWFKPSLTDALMYNISTWKIPVLGPTGTILSIWLTNFCHFSICLTDKLLSPIICLTNVCHLSICFTDKLLLPLILLIDKLLSPFNMSHKLLSPFNRSHRQTFVTYNMPHRQNCVTFQYASQTNYCSL